MTLWSRGLLRPQASFVTMLPSSQGLLQSEGPLQLDMKKSYGFSAYVPTLNDIEIAFV